MVPVALNANRIPENEAGAFFRAIMATNKMPQGLWIVSPAGKVLAYHYFRAQSGEKPSRGKARWLSETLEFIDAGLKAYGPVTTRRVSHNNLFPERGCGFAEGKGIRLSAYVIQVRKGRREGDPVVDSVFWKEEMWQALIPPKLELDTRWAIPEGLLRSCAPVMSYYTDSLYTPQAQDMKKVEMQARVVAIETNRILIRLDGLFASEHYRENNPKLPISSSASATGYVTYDPLKKKMDTILIVFKGDYKNVPPWNTRSRFASVLEWQRAPAK